MPELDFSTIASGLGVNTPLAWVCWSLFKKLQEVQKRERDNLIAQRDLLQKVALRLSKEGGGDV